MAAFRRSPLFVVIAGTTILALAIGIRLTFGLFLQPMSAAHGWGRETFAFAIALQNLLWGFTQPFFGAVADRYGSGRVVAVGGIGYAVGLYLMSSADTALAVNFTAGLIVGLSLSATSFAVVLGAVGRAVSEQRRSLALGVASAGGSIGQFALLPAAQGLIATQGWVAALGSLGLIAALMVPLAAAVAGKGATAEVERPQGFGEALAEAGRRGGYWLLTAGFFVCGFQVTFIGTHLPAYIVDQNLPAGLGATALGLVGFFNIIGSAFWGYMGGRYSKTYNLSVLYLARAVVIGIFLYLPVTTWSVLIFSGAMGFMWLGTVPLTSALVGQMFGVRYLSTLFGIVFFSHQVGAFVGVWLGGYLYDVAQSYTPVWLIALALGVIAAILHWPIDERPSVRAELAPEGN